MEKVVDYLGEHIQPVKLYFDDISKLFQIFSEVSSEIEIETNGYKFQNVNGLKKLDKESVNTLKIKCRDPYISLDVKKRGGIWLVTDRDLPAQRGIFEKVKKELVQKKRYFIPMISYPILSIIVLNIAIYIGLPYIDNPANHIFIIILVTLVIGCLIGYSTYLIFRNKKSLIILNKKINSPTFWKRNRDGIIIAIISSIIGAVAGALITFGLTQP